MYGCREGQRVPCEHESVGVGLHILQPGRKVVSAGFEARGGGGAGRGPPGSAPAPGVRPHPRSRLGASSHCTRVFRSWFHGAYALGFTSRGMTGSSPPLPHNSPFVSLPRPPPIQFHNPSRVPPHPPSPGLGKGARPQPIPFLTIFPG